jgi:hypothetical protein
MAGSAFGSGSGWRWFAPWVEGARWLVPSATFLNTDAIRPDLIHLPSGDASCVAKRVTNRSGIEKHGSPSRT